ncbi:MAG: alpha/beta hydrolase [Xanthobacteraceae bacterium]
MSATSLTRRRAVELIGAAISASLSPTAAGADAKMVEEPWSHGGLAGTLTLPKSAPRGPAVLIIAGSGPTDRDGNGPLISTDTYRLLAAGLAAHGIRSLRYDKRGIGGSAGLVTHEEEMRFDDLVGDAVAACRSLCGRDDVSSLVLAGHSEGGLIAMRAARQLNVAGLVLLAAPGRPLADILRTQFRTAPMPEALRAEALRITDALAAGERVTDIPGELAPVFRPSVQPYLASVLPIDPRSELAQLSTPVLLLYAARDLQIPLNDRDRLARARPDARVVTVPTANHVLKRAPPDREGNIKTYSDRSLPLDPGVLPPIVLFVGEVSAR